MSTDPTAVQTAALTEKKVHETWEDEYQESRNEAFYDMAFARLLGLTEATETSTFLEVGCGGGRHAIRVARHGIKVEAIDFADAALEIARANVQRAGLEDLVTLKRGDILDLAYPDDAFSHVLCWGVLMHIPQVEQALSSLARVVAPGGYLILHEGNVQSPEARAILAAKRLRHRLRGTSGPKRTPAGVENWNETSEGTTVLTRRAYVPYLIETVERDGLVLRERLSSQLTELYVKAPWTTARRVMYGANEWWYRHGAARFAVTNTLVFQKSRHV